MKGGELIREARKRAGLSQVELAQRLGTRQPVVARWESLARSPSLENITRAVRACGFELHHSIGEQDLNEASLIAQWRQLSPKERLQHNRQMLVTERWARRARRVPKKSV